MNPFIKNSMPIDKLDELFGRDEVVNKIKEYVESKVQTAIFGVEGVGKTSLLKSVFSTDYRIKKAKEKILISPVTEFPSGLKHDDIFDHFIEIAINSVRVLSSCGMEDEMNGILSELEPILSTNKTRSDIFESVIGCIYKNGYHIVMVIDNFERFTHSNEVTMHHHGILRSMLEKIQYIVSTNYDFNETSLPENVSGSLYLMNFGGHEITVRGWTYDETVTYINSCLNGQEISFSPKLVDLICKDSGGIPLLVKLISQFAYNYIESNNTESGMDLYDFHFDPKVQLILQHWSRLLTPSQIKSMRHLLNGNVNEEDKYPLTSLQLRGVLNYKTETDEYGRNIIKDDKYCFCNKYLEFFCEDGRKLEAAAEKNPLKRFAGKKTVDSSASDIITTMLNPEININVEEYKGLIIELYRRIADSCGLTKPIDFKEDLSDGVLQEFEIYKELLDQFSPQVRDFVINGIKVERTFYGVNMLDFSPAYVSFAKAVEAHLNYTLVPVLKAISPNCVLYINGVETLLKNADHLMLGNVKFVLAQRYSGTGGSFTSNAAQYCQRNLNGFDASWWNRLKEELGPIKTERNNIPHPNYFSSEEGKQFLSRMFGGNDCFFLRCQRIYEAFQKSTLKKY